MPMFLLPLLRQFGPYFLAALVGAYAMHWFDSLRYDHLKNEYQTYILNQENAAFAAEKSATELRERTANDWAQNLTALRDCYRAGRCLPNLPTGSGLKVPAAASPDGTGGYPIPATAELAAACAETTLQLNALQNQIEGQP